MRVSKEVSINGFFLKNKETRTTAKGKEQVYSLFFKQRSVAVPYEIAEVSENERSTIRVKMLKPKEKKGDLLNLEKIFFWNVEDIPSYYEEGTNQKWMPLVRMLLDWNEYRGKLIEMNKTLPRKRLILLYTEDRVMSRVVDQGGSEIGLDDHDLELYSRRNQLSQAGRPFTHLIRASHMESNHLMDQIHLACVFSESTDFKATQRRY